MLKRIVSYIHSHGAAYTLHHAGELLDERLHHPYDRLWREKLCPGEEELAYQRAHQPEGVGTVSVIVPVYNTEPRLLRELAESFIAQTYTDWEACLYDGCSPRADTGAMLAEIAALDPRIHVTRGTANDGIAGNSNHALDMAHGDWIALCDHDDLLTPDALWRMAEAAAKGDADLIYSDEDKINEDGSVFYAPNFKPDFCPDNLRSGNYVCHLMLLRRETMERAGRFHAGFDGSQDHDLTLRCSEITDRIVHVPRVLYHWRTLKSSASHSNLDKCTDAACRAVEEHIRRIGLPGRVENMNGQPRIRYDTKPGAKIDVIAVESGDPQLWAGFYRELARAAGPDVRFTIISPWKDSAIGVPDCRWIEWRPQENVFACMNRAARAADGEFLVFLHGAVVMQGDTWLEELQMYAQRDDVGAVTPQLVDHAGRIVHGGFALELDRPVMNRGAGLPRQAGGWHGMMTTSHNVGAVSAACLMIRRDHFIPFDEGYTGALGTADWCLKLSRNGLRHVYTPHARGRLQDQTARNWLLAEKDIPPEDEARFRAAWGEHVHDPCYSELCGRKRADWSLPEL